MDELTIAQVEAGLEWEAAELLALHPSDEDIAEMRAGTMFMIEGVTRTKKGWKVHPMMRAAVRAHGAERVLLRAARTLAALSYVQATKGSPQ